MTGASVVLVSPLAPDERGNGLAMRAGMLLEAISAAAEVDVVVVPVAGPAAVSEWTASLARRVVTVDPVEERTADDAVMAQVADSSLRDRLVSTVPLPQRARLAPPTLVDDACARLASSSTRRSSTSPVSAVVTMREYLAPFGLTLGRRLSARVVVDLDDDAEALLERMGRRDEAAAYGRLARAWLPDAAAVSAASPDEAAAIAARYGLARVDTIPNAVRAPATVTARPGQDRVLYVGNFTYAPNADAARLLVDEVLPALRRVRPGASVDLVGPVDERVARLADRPAVRVTGEVPDVAPWYEGADVVVVPLEHASGTRIKVLEAFAHRRPVVATGAAVAGIAVTPGVDVVVASSPESLARAADAVLRDAGAATRLVEHAWEVWRGHYAPSAVAPRIRTVVFGHDPLAGTST